GCASGHSCGKSSSFHAFCGGGFRNGGGTNLFCVFRLVPPFAPTAPTRTHKNCKQRATCQPPRLPDAALRHTCVANALPALPISRATATITSFETPHSFSAASGVAHAYSRSSATRNASNVGALV